MGVVGDILRRLRGLCAPGSSGSGAGIVGFLNVRRPQRARRLFTDLFTPVLAEDDPVLLRCARPVPGLIQRVDLAGLWVALECSSFTELTAGVQSALDEQAADTLLDEVLKSPEALEGQRRMRDAALRTLDELLQDGRDLSGFLDLLNRERLAEARRQVSGLEALAPLGRPFLRFVCDYLRVSERCAGQLAASNGDAEANTFAALIALNVGRQYGAVALMLRDHGRPKPVVDALIAHFSACCASLGERLYGNAAISDDGLGRLTLILPALIVAGVLEDPESGAVFRSDWRRLAGAVEAGLAAAPARGDAGEVLRLAGAWHQLARTYDQEVEGIEQKLAELKSLVEGR